VSNADLIIVGAGPVGLCLAKALSLIGLKVILLEQQAQSHVAQAKFDGREIALTHGSKLTMQQLGMWDKLATDSITPILEARIFNGASLFSLDIKQEQGEEQALGYLVSNHLIRQAAYDVVQADTNIQIRYQTSISKITQHPHSIEITLQDGESIQTKLLVGADSRFSETRRAMGIAADMHDFGKTMMVCQMTHHLPHEHAAWEWFDYGQTLALLPMHGMQSSVVLTLAKHEMDDLMRQPVSEFNAEIARRFKHRLGAMQLVSPRHAYPLVTAYAKRFVSQRFVLVGDAAVGMHPVTAHGFNFGLKSVVTLSNLIKQAVNKNQDIAANAVLLAYERQHRKETRPLFLATHAVAKLYNSDKLPLKILRAGALHIGQRVKPFKRKLAGFLSEQSNSQGLT
jgi:ubiquinone biosynthesis UbiH/UbiF/VisC/COQ6 family hydroxylase